MQAEEQRTSAATGVPYSGWWRRVGATLLDGLIGLVPYAAVRVGLTAAGVPVLVALLCAAAAWFAIIAALMARDGEHNGQSLGKQALGIKVVTDGPVTFGRAYLREFVGKALLGVTVIWTLLDCLWPLWDAQNQALHDKIATTWVLHPAAGTAQEPPPPPQRDADWYEDPTGEARVRYWDGETWTSHTAP